MIARQYHHESNSNLACFGKIGMPYLSGEVMNRSAATADSQALVHSIHASKDVQGADKRTL